MARRAGDGVEHGHQLRRRSQGRTCRPGGLSLLDAGGFSCATLVGVPQYNARFSGVRLSCPFMPAILHDTPLAQRLGLLLRERPRVGYRAIIRLRSLAAASAATDA